MPLDVEGDELAVEVGQHQSGSVSSSHKHRLHPLACSLELILVRSVFFSAVGVGQVAIASSAASCPNQCRKTLSRAGWIWV